MGLEIEVWKDIPNYVGFYQASSTGRIRSIDRVTEKLVDTYPIRKQNRVNQSKVIRNVQ